MAQKINNSPEVAAYKKYVVQKLSVLFPLFAKASVGDFSENAPLITQEDEFTPLFAGIQVMIDVIREQISEQKEKMAIEKQIRADLYTRSQELKLANERIEKEKAADEALLKSIGDGVIAIDTLGNIILINPRAQEMLGVTDIEVVGKPAREIAVLKKSQGEVIPWESRPIYLALQGGETVTAGLKERYQLIDTHKHVFPVAITASAISVGNKVVGAIEVIRDITREWEQEENKDEFVAIAAHQLRTPLVTMRWNMELLTKMKAEVPLEMQTKLESIYENNQKLITLVNELLDVSKIISGIKSTNVENTSIAPIILQKKKELDEFAQQKQVTVSTHISDSLPLISVQPKRFEDVLSNLIQNAIKFNSPKGTVVIRAFVKDAHAYIVVEDTGIGIPLSDQKQLFNKFFRARNATQIQGTGLGLFLVKSYIEGWGGRIEVQSPLYKEGRGTAITIVLPIARKTNGSDSET